MSQFPPQAFSLEQGITAWRSRELAAHEEIADLVERFERNKESHKSGHYSEVQGGSDALSPQSATSGPHASRADRSPAPDRGHLPLDRRSDLRALRAD
jgi:hypothetical protein